MAKFDAVDRLMKLATERAASGGGRDAERVLEEQVTGTEPGVPLAAPKPVESKGERGRQLLGALRPLLPAAGFALRRVEHPAAQAVARLLPLLNSVRAAAAAQPAPTPIPVPDAFRMERSALEGELKTIQSRVDSQEEQLRRTREGLERIAAEQGSLSHLVHGLADRSRLLTAAVVLLLVLQIAEIVLLAVYLRR